MSPAALVGAKQTNYTVNVGHTRLDMARRAGMPSGGKLISALSETRAVSGACVEFWDLAASVTGIFDDCAALACETSRRLFGVSLTF